jgi:hypothetical protein
MIDSGYQDTTANINFSESRYGVLVTIIEEDRVTNEFRWARGDKQINGMENM